MPLSNNSGREASALHYPIDPRDVKRESLEGVSVVPEYGRTEMHFDFQPFNKTEQSSKTCQNGATSPRKEELKMIEAQLKEKKEQLKREVTLMNEREKVLLLEVKLKEAKMKQEIALMRNRESDISLELAELTRARRLLYGQAIGKMA